jgi:hypothetical protein
MEVPRSLRSLIPSSKLDFAGENICAVWDSLPKAPKETKTLDQESSTNETSESEETMSPELAHFLKYGEIARSALNHQENYDGFNHQIVKMGGEGEHYFVHEYSTREEATADIPFLAGGLEKTLAERYEKYPEEMKGRAPHYEFEVEKDSDVEAGPEEDTNTSQRSQVAIIVRKNDGEYNRVYDASRLGDEQNYATLINYELAEDERGEQSLIRGFETPGLAEMAGHLIKGSLCSNGNYEFEVQPDKTSPGKSELVIKVRVEE